MSSTTILCLDTYPKRFLNSQHFDQVFSLLKIKEFQMTPKEVGFSKFLALLSLNFPTLTISLYRCKGGCMSYMHCIQLLCHDFPYHHLRHAHGFSSIALSHVRSILAIHTLQLSHFFSIFLAYIALSC